MQDPFVLSHYTTLTSRAHHSPSLPTPTPTCNTPLTFISTFKHPNGLLTHHIYTHPSNPLTIHTLPPHPEDPTPFYFLTTPPATNDTNISVNHHEMYHIPGAIIHTSTRGECGSDYTSDSDSDDDQHHHHDRGSRNYYNAHNSSSLSRHTHLKVESSNPQAWVVVDSSCSNASISSQRSRSRERSNIDEDAMNWECRSYSSLPDSLSSTASNRFLSFQASADTAEYEYESQEEEEEEEEKEEHHTQKHELYSYTPSVDPDGVLDKCRSTAVTV